MDRVFTYPIWVARNPSEPAVTLTASALALRDNLRRLMAANPELGSNPKLGKKTGLGASAISRLVNGHNATMETLDRVAAVFGLVGWQLLLPDLDPSNPPVVQISAREAELYRKLRELMKAEAS